MPAPVVGPIIIAAATAAVGSFFQNRSARIANKRHLQEAELAQAREIFKEVSTSMDNLYYYLRHAAMHVAVRRAKEDSSLAEEDGRIWDAYEQALVHWLTNRNRFSTQVRRYFGQENQERLIQIQDGFEKSKTLVAATFYNRKGSVVKDGKENSRKYYALLVPLRETLTDLGDGMMEKIQNQTVGLLEEK